MAAATVLIVLVACTTDPLPGYRAATADERASILATVQDYYAIANQAYSHGLFTWTYTSGGGPTKGELSVRFDMTRDRGSWSIDQTDEWVLGEGAPSPTPR